MKTGWSKIRVGFACVMLVAAFSCASAMAADNKEQKDAKSAAGGGTYFIQPGDVVMFLGDSITAETKYYYKLYYNDIAKKYPDLVDSPIAPYNGKGWGGDKLRFVNAGVSGEESGGGKNRIAGLLAQHKPTVVVICYGMNDSLHGNPGGYKENMRAIIKAVKEAKCAVTVLSSPSVCTVGHQDKVPHVKTLGELRDQAKEVAADEGVLFADCYVLTREYEEKNNKDFTWGDGVHPNEDGHRMMADALEKVWNFGGAFAKAGDPRPGVKAGAKSEEPRKAPAKTETKPRDAKNSR